MRELGSKVLAVARSLIPSDQTIKAIKARDPRKRVNDGDGLFLLLFVKGGVHGWRFAYSLAGKRNNISLGTYPDTSLALARRKADEARKLVSEGTDPSEARTAAKAGPVEKRAEQEREAAGLRPAGPFEAVALEWPTLVHEPNVSTRYAMRSRIQIDRDVLPPPDSGSSAQRESSACAARRSFFLGLHRLGAGHCSDCPPYAGLPMNTAP